MDNDSLKIERQFIHLLLHNKELVDVWMNSSLKEDYFHSSHRFILKSISICYDKNVLLNRKTFDSMLSSFSSPKERIEQSNLFLKCQLMEKATVDDFPTLSESILDSFIFNKVSESVESYNVLRKKHNNVYALKDLMGKLQDLEVESVESDKILFSDINEITTPYLQTIKDINSGKIVKKKKVLCGIKEIDETMVTGFQPGTFTLFCADIGGFKSCIMLNVGLNIWKIGHNVLFVPIEMASEQMWNRALARESGVPTERLFNPEKLTPENIKACENIAEQWKNCQSKFYILQLPGMTSVSGIKRQIEKHIDIFQPEVVIIDYMDNLEPDKNFKDRHDLEIHDMILKLRNAGLNKGFAVVSAAQLGRDALKKIRKGGSNKNDKEQVSFHSEDIRGAHSFAMAADNVYAQNPNSNQPTSMLDFFVIKARNGKTKFPNGTMRGELELFPEIGLIRGQCDFDAKGDISIDNYFTANEDDDIIKKDDTAIFDDEKDNVEPNKDNNENVKKPAVYFDEDEI